MHDHITIALCGIPLVLKRNFGHRMLAKIWVGTFLVQNAKPRVKTEFILMIKMETETRRPVEGQFGSEFPAVCNHCRVMAA